LEGVSHPLRDFGRLNTAHAQWADLLAEPVEASSGKISYPEASSGQVKNRSFLLPFFCIQFTWLPPSKFNAKK
jgi:hypothetical protein